MAHMTMFYGKDVCSEKRTDNYLAELVSDFQLLVLAFLSNDLFPLNSQLRSVHNNWDQPSHVQSSV